MAVTEGVQEQQHHYIICFSSQLVPIHFSNLGPTPACCESEGYRDKVCVSCTHCLHSVGTSAPIIQAATSGLSCTRVLLLHTPPSQCFTTKMNVLPHRDGSQSCESGTPETGFL